MTGVILNSNRPMPGQCLRLLLCAILLPAVLPAVLRADPRTLEEDWRWVRFSTVDGLPADRVGHIVEDAAGTPWAGTSGGLAWYDGYRWHAAGASQNLPAGRVDSLAAAPGGGVIVVIDGRLFRGDAGGFEEIPLIVEGNTWRIASAVPCPEDRILIFSWKPDLGSGALFVYNGSTVVPVDMPAAIAKVAPGTRNKRLWSTSGGRTWVSTMKGVYRWSLDRWELFSPTSWDVIMHLAQNNDGTGIAAVGARTYEEGMKLAEWYDGDPQTMQALEVIEPIQAVAVGPHGEAIVVYETGRVEVRDNGQWQPIVDASHRFSRALCMAYRDTGDLWIGTEHGLFLHKHNSRRWTRWAHPAPDRLNWIHEILHTNDGSFWIATRDGLEIHRPDGSSQAIPEILGTELKTVTGLGQDEDGNVWVTSGGVFKGAFRWGGSTWKHVGEQQGLMDAVYHAIHKDRQGRLWFLGLSTETGPVALQGPDESPGAFVYSKGKFTRWSTADGLLHGRVFALADGDDGSLWFGTLGGLSRWKEGSWTHWTSKDGLRIDRIFTAAIDHDGRLWFSDQLSGLGFIDDNDQPQYLTTRDGLAHDEVYDIAVAGDGALWISTQGGISRYDNGVWSNLGADEGLAGERTWPILEVDDQLYVGTFGWGVNILDLQESRGRAPRITLEDPVIDEELVLCRWHPFTYWGHIPTEQIETRYRFAGEPWSKWRTDPTAELKHLTPGDYRLEVQAKGLLGELTTESLTFSIPAPLHRRAEFLAPLLALSAVAVVLAFLLIIRRQRYERALREERHAAEIAHVARVSTAGELAAGLAHELNQPLCSIVTNAQTAQRVIKSAPAGTEALNDALQDIVDAGKRAGEIIHHLREFLTKGEAQRRRLSVNRVILQLSHIIEAATDRAGVAIDFDLADGLPAVSGDRIQLQQVVLNLVQNAVEACQPLRRGAGQLIIRTSRNGTNAVSVCVCDNGAGLATADIDQAFEPFYSTKSGGLGMGLSISRTIIEAHDGRLWAEPNPDQGTSLCFTLPGI